MEGADRLIQRVRAWARARNALRGGLAALILLLCLGLGARALGGRLPALVWVFLPALTSVGALWPLGGEGFLLRAGRSLGLGERLAAAQVLLRRGAEGLLGLLLSEIHTLRPRPWRLLLGRGERIGTAAALVLLCAFLLSPEAAPPPSGSADIREEPPWSPALAPAEPGQVIVTPIPEMAPHFSPYEDLLAAILGLEELPEGSGSPEGLAELLADEGLLRKLAERIAEATPGDISEGERRELLPLAQGLARPDIAGELWIGAQEGDEEAAAKEEAIRAALEAERTTPSQERGGEERLAPETGEPGEREGGQPRSAGAVEPGEGGLSPGITEAEGELAGLGPGAEPTPAEGEMAPEPVVDLPLSVTPGEGPVRAAVVPGVPGEPSEGAGEGEFYLSPQEVELILRARGVPLELRELVRRYFELITGQGGGG